eukprot:scaffold23505_cov60-Phaeocystis_antarctica.AAC.1
MRGHRKVWRRATEKNNAVLASVVPLSCCRRARARAPSRRHTAACIEATLRKGRPHVTTFLKPLPKAQAASSRKAAV